MKVLLQASRFAVEHERSALVTVVATSGSTPRHAGCHMLVSADGTQVGTVGGGAIEYEILATARSVALSGVSRFVKHNLVRDLAMCCGGSMELYVEPLASCLGAILRALDLRNERKASLLMTDVASGHKSFSGEFDGFCEYPRLSGSIFSEVVAPSQRIILFGCGHVSREIGPLARDLEFDVVICDDNQSMQVNDRLTWASTVVASFDLRDVEKQIGGVGAGDYLVILSRDHAIDQQILEAALPLIDEVEYLGVIGSLGKLGRFRKRIAAKVRVDERQWEKLHVPIGLDIAAETPLEIAVSVMAELISIRNRRK